MRWFIRILGVAAVSFWLARSLAVLPAGRIVAGALAPSLCILAGTLLPLRQAAVLGVLLGLLHDLDRGFAAGFGPATLLPVVVAAAALGRRVRFEHAPAPLALGALGVLVQQVTALALLAVLRVPADPVGSLGIHLLAGGLVTLALWRPGSVLGRWAADRQGEAARL